MFYTPFVYSPQANMLYARRPELSALGLPQIHIRPAEARVLMRRPRAK